MNDHGPTADGLPNGGPPDEDALWNSIVDNFGDRAELTPDELDATLPPAPPAPPEPQAEAPESLLDRFHPPPPPPLPRPEPPALLAWGGVLVAPLLLIGLFLFLPGLFPTVVAVLLLMWFLGGFAYLVSAMPSEPPDPWDDGARL